jgi:hypothetical protein
LQLTPFSVYKKTRIKCEINKNNDKKIQGSNVK